MPCDSRGVSFFLDALYAQAADHAAWLSACGRLGPLEDDDPTEALH